MTTMTAGFMTERTAEYILVPNLIRQLGISCAGITPFFFWRSREGQRKARDSYDGQVRILAAYARRPKVLRVGQPTVEVKFNSLLFHHAWLLAQAGIPLLAGVPCVSRLTDLQLDSPCAWFGIEPHEDRWGDAYASLEIQDRRQAQFRFPDSPVSGPLGSAELVRVLAESPAMSWPEAIDALEELSRDIIGGLFSRNLWFGRLLPYRPFFLAEKI